jgi:hypothetical protein
MYQPIIRHNTLLLLLLIGMVGVAQDVLVFEPVQSGNGKRIVLISGDEEYRTEESMPMLAKILSQKHGFHCTVLFSLGPDGAQYIDPNNSKGLRGLESLGAADLMVIGTRFRNPSPDEAIHITQFLKVGKPVLGFRTATHAFKGDGQFGTIPYNDFGLHVLGETWVSHHGKHKVEGARGVIEPAQADHPILRGVRDIFAPSDVYGVIHLTDSDQILLRAAVTESLEPNSPNVSGGKNQSLQPLAWLREYRRPDGEGTGRAFCTTAGASVDFVNEDLRRLLVNAVHFLTELEVPQRADVAFVDPYYPSFFGFIPDPVYWKELNLRPRDFMLGKSPHLPDPKGSPDWPHRDRPR